MNSVNKFLRYPAAAILLFAGTMKLLQSQKLIFLGTENAVWLLILSFAEFVIGALLLLNTYPKFMKKMSILLFSCFLGISIAKISNGDSECGCFGNLKVSPYLTSIFDICAVSTLCYWSPKPRSQAKNHGVAVVSFVTLTSLTVFVFVAFFVAPSSVSPTGEITGTGIVVLAPDKLKGQSLALHKHISGDLRYMSGVWTLILYQSHCEKCQFCLSRYQANSAQVAFVEIPPYEGTFRLERDNKTWRFLDDKHDWFVTTPLIVELHDGVVSEVTQYSGRGD